MTLKTLEERLKAVSHTQNAIGIVQEFCESLKDTEARMALWNMSSAIVRRAITQESVYSLGYTEEEDRFTLLQGDIVATDSAYFFGERISGEPKYAVLNSSCDLIPQRRQTASLLRLIEIRKTDTDAKKLLNLLLRFRKTDSMYIPRLPMDDPAVVGNAIHFDGLCQIRTEQLLLASRIASLSLVGWRIFASFSKVVYSRANDREVAMRESIERADNALPAA